MGQIGDNPRRVEVIPETPPGHGKPGHGVASPDSGGDPATDS